MDVNEKALEAAVQAAKKAGDQMLTGFYAVKHVDTKTASHDLVTEYDKETERIIISELQKVFPSHRFIGEESVDDSGNDIQLTDEPTWIIDPIDGTINYVHGFPESAISIGFAINKEVTVGVIYNPALNNLYTACKGKGAFQNGKQIKVSQCTEHVKSVVATEISFGCIPSLHKKVMERVSGLVKKAHGIRSIGSAATTLAYVANGSLDAYVQDELACWDVAAGILIVKEAGGVVLNSDGCPFDLMAKKLFVAATETLANELLEVIKLADKISSSTNVL